MMDNNIESDGRTSGPKANYIVLRVHDLDRSVQFFQSLGFVLTAEQHGSGPRHYSFPLRPNFVCELYPQPSATAATTSSNVRLGIEVQNLDALRASLTNNGVPIVRESNPGAERRYLVFNDPDGNQIEAT